MDITTDLLQIKIDAARALLPKESRESIDAVNWKFIISGMSDKYTSDQLEDLTNETELLLCGLLFPEDYEKELVQRMMLTKEEVNLLVKELDNLIFKKIQTELEKRISSTVSKNNEEKQLVLDPRFITLPKEIQEAIARSDWRNKLYEISKGFKINIEQKGILEDLTVRVIQNNIHPENFETEVASKITLPKEDISILIKDINENILKNIRYFMEEGNNSSKQQVVRSKEGENNSSKEEDVPLPPYAAPIKNVELIIKNETPVKSESSMQVYGIEESTVAPAKIRDVLKDAWPTKPIKPIQEVIATENIIPSKNIMDDKLKGITVSNNTVSDYSTPKMSSVQRSDDIKPDLRSHDPYREEF